MQQYEDASTEDRPEPTDGAAAAPAAPDPGTPRSDRPANHSNPAPAANAPRAEPADSDDDDTDDEPPRPDGGYWRQGAASRPPSPGPAMADNASDASSMMPAQRPKSRVELATSRYSNLSYWRARRVVFYKNGDPFFPGIELRLVMVFSEIGNYLVCNTHLVAFLCKFRKSKILCVAQCFVRCLGLHSGKILICISFHCEQSFLSKRQFLV